MTWLLPFLRLRLLLVLALICFFALPPSAHAQEQEIQIPGREKTLPVCKPVDLNTTVSFYNAPHDFFTVAFDMENVSGRACVPQPQTGSPMFEVAPGKELKPFGLCMDCADRLPNGQYRLHPPVVLSPGDFGHQTLQWKTVAPSDGAKCFRLNALFGPVLVVAPPLFPQVCSEIAVSPTYAGAFAPPSTHGEVETDNAPGGEVFILSSGKSRYYQDEYFLLHVGLVSPGAGAPSGEDCPSLFLRVKSPDGATRFDAVQPAGFKSCKSFMWGADRNKDWQSGFEVDSGVRSLWGGLGEHSIELFAPLGFSTNGRMQFARSNEFTVQIDDPALIPRKWGPKVKGVAADVTLDKDTYQLGEDIPLHIAVENFDAPVPVYAIDPVWDPCPAISVQVRNSQGQLLPESQRSSPGICMGHGRGPVPYPLGKLVPMERSLAAQGWLPAHSGTYTVVVTWCPIDGTNYQPGPGISITGDTKPYATVQAAATFRITGEQLPAPQSPR